MALNIEIPTRTGSTYRLKSDDMQIIIQRKHTVDPTKAPNFDADEHSSELRTEWRNWKYCGKVSQALEVIAKQNILESEATELYQLRSEIAEFSRDIKRLMGEGDQEVSSELESLISLSTKIKSTRRNQTYVPFGYASKTSR